jgi:DNA-binding transcriptional LysR family regulator
LLEFQDEEVHFVSRAAVCVSHFVAVAPLLEVTDMVAKLPHRLALWLTAHTQVVLLDLPYSPITADVEMVWHQRANRDRDLQWLTQQLAACAGDLT